MRIEPDRQTVPQGTIAELRCLSTTDPSIEVQWSKVNENLSPNCQVCKIFCALSCILHSNHFLLYIHSLRCVAYFLKITGSVLRIPSAQVKDRGIYLCRATNEGGTGQASSILDIERMRL